MLLILKIKFYMSEVFAILRDIFVSLLFMYLVVKYIFNFDVIDFFREKGIIRYQTDMDKEVETHKAKLAKDMENYKSELEEKKIELQQKLTYQIESNKIKLEPLQAERLTAIKDVYAELTKLYDNVKGYTALFRPANGKSKEEQIEDINNSLKNLSECWISRKLFFPKEMADLIDSFIIACYSKASLTSWIGTSQGKEAWKEQEKIDKYVTEDMPKVLNAIEDKFRKILGIE